MRTLLALTIVASAVSVGTAADIKSGLQVGDYPAAFYVADITGPAAPSCATAVDTVQSQLLTSSLARWIRM